MSSSDPEWNDYQCLHPKVVELLQSNGLLHPTKIQAEVFHNYPNYYDFLIASQTGSGKTFAFAAPMISEIRTKFMCSEGLPQTLLGLVLSPTRELAQQIESNMQMILEDSGIRIASIIGGMSRQKQRRILSKVRPQILIGTPGRLWEFLEEDQLNFSNLKYLVVDEADRMIELGHFKEIDALLQKIFSPKVEEQFDEDFHEIKKAMEEKSQGSNLYIKKDGKKVKLEMNLHGLEAGKLFKVPEGLFSFEGEDNDNVGKFTAKNTGFLVEADRQDESGEMEPEEVAMLTEEELNMLSKIKRKVFFVSATLTREFTGMKYFTKKDRSHARRKGEKKNKDKSVKNEEKNNDEDGEVKEVYNKKLQALISHVKFTGNPKIIDQSSELFFPPKLVEKICFTEDEIEKMVYLFLYLQELPPNSKTIIFTNTIKISRRIQYFVTEMGYLNATLHSHMQQKQRLKKLQRFRDSKSVNILISTDVAARGLDFQISNVVQYGVPINGDTYVHRAGRTARANRNGESFVLIDKKETNRWHQLQEVLKESAPGRNVVKYITRAKSYEMLKAKIEKLEWIRRNEEGGQNKRLEKLAEQEANQMDIEVEKPKQRKLVEEDKARQVTLKKKINNMRRETQANSSSKGEGMELNKWKKNKLVLSPAEIRMMMNNQ